MKIVAISDTHNQHRNIKLPNGDMIIHAGDMTGIGRKEEIIDFLDWYSNLNYKYKILIAGNHDWYFENTPSDVIQQSMPDNIIYLNDNGITIEGINIWGSPVQPWFHNWAFNRIGEEIKYHWSLIPDNTDILVTHSPPYGILDKTTRGNLTGCPFLLKKIKKIKPQLNIFGHIHEAYGVHKENGTTYINASVLDERYRYTNEAIVFDITKK